MPSLIATALCLLSPACLAQTNELAPGSLATLQPVSPGIARLEGTEPASGIHYVRIFLTAQPAAPASTPATIVGTQDAPAFDLGQPTLTAQCSVAPNGKLRFELFVNFGGVTDPKFYAPWHATRDDLYPPRTEKQALTLEFLGYTKVKPVRRQFEQVPQPAGQWRYNSPGPGSSNLEELGYFFQYLKSLPTLRVSSPQHTASFLMTPLFARLQAEPLCSSSGL